MIKIKVPYIDNNSVEQRQELWFHLDDVGIDHFVREYDPAYADFEEHIVGEGLGRLKPSLRGRILSNLIDASYVEKDPYYENSFTKNLSSSFYHSEVREALLVTLLREYYIRVYFVVGLLGRENSQKLQIL